MGITAFEGDQLSLWPIRPRPLPDELLSSWMIRLAHDNGKKVQRFYRHWFGRDSLTVWTRDIDRLAPPGLLDELARRTGVLLEQMENTTLRSLIGHVFTELPTGGLTPWLLTLGVFHRQRRRGGLMCCVGCLRDDETPYFRKAWRLSWVTACTRHSTMLIDRCPCGATLQPHRVDMRERNWLGEEVCIAACWSCGVDLRKLAGQVADPGLLSFQRIAEHAREHGYANVAGRDGLHSILFFQGIRVLLLAAIRLMVKSPERTGVTRFEELPVERRAIFLARVGRLLENWPSEFHQTFRFEASVYSQFTRYSQSRPFWVDEEVSLLKRARVEFTESERIAIESVLEANFGKFSNALAKSIFGRDVSRRQAHVRPRITQDDADMVLAGIDIAASTATGVEREDLIRDRTMFLTARLLRMSQQAIRNMRAEDYLSEGDDEPLNDTPVNDEECRVYLRRYVRLDRVKHPRARSSPWLFLCSSSSGHMSDSLVSARYANALRVSAMERRVRAYRDWIATPAEPQWPSPPADSAR